MVIPLLESLDITDKTFTVDALLTQRTLARYLLQRQAHYVFPVKGNQPTLFEAIKLLFAERGAADFREEPALAHGRIESRAIWTSTRLNDYLDFPGIAQVFVIERHVTDKKTGKSSTDTAYGVTSHASESVTPAQLLAYNRGHWTIENACHYILDWNWDEDRHPIRCGHAPENLTALRRFAIGIIKSKRRDSVSSTILRLARNVRLVFDYLRMSANSRPRRVLQEVG